MPRAPISYGYFGKYPYRGDFVRAGLSPSVIEAIDAWATNGMASLRTQSADNFEEWYSCAPLWRFAASGGVFGEGCTAGVIAGGVDLAGRPFPFFAGATNLPCSNPKSLLTEALAWFIKLEDAVTGLFEGSLSIESFLTLLPAEEMSENVIEEADNRIWFEAADHGGGPARRLTGTGPLTADLFCSLFLPATHAGGRYFDE